MNATDRLFEPFQLGTLHVPGRICKTATAETRADDDGFVTDALLDFYRPMAEAGTPLIITGNLYVSRVGKSSPRQTGADDDDKIPGLRRLAELVHAGGGTLFAQLNHCGRQVMAEAMGLDRAVSASDVSEKMMGTKPRPMTVAEIEAAVQDFAQAARRCQEAGFDGVQIHAGHGYVISQFLTPYTNRRTDAYGGDFDRRLRFLREVYEATRAICGPDYPIIMKLNGHDALPGRQGLGTAELVRVAQAMEALGLDGVEITCGHYESGFPMIRGYFHEALPALVREGLGANLPASRRIPLRIFGGAIGRVFNALWAPQEGFNAGYARQFKQALKMPVIVVGGFHSGAAMQQAIDSGACDAVSVARGLVADPLLVHHLRTGQSGPQCSYCNGCIVRAGTMPVDCYDDAVKAEQERAWARFQNERPTAAAG